MKKSSVTCTPRWGSQRPFLRLVAHARFAYVRDTTSQPAVDGCHRQKLTAYTCLVSTASTRSTSRTTLGHCARASHHCMSESLRLYRILHRAINQLPVAPIQKKLRYNTRQLFDLYRSPQTTADLQQLHSDTRAAIEILTWFRKLPQVHYVQVHFRRNVSLC